MKDRTDTAQIFRDGEADRGFRASFWTGRVAIYAVLIFWAFICLFPIYWTITTTFKAAPDVMQGNLVPLGFPAQGAGAAVAGPVVEHDLRGIDGARGVSQAVLELGGGGARPRRWRWRWGARRPTGSAGSTTSSASCAMATSRSSSCRS
jgi:ABC-type glycerol-3-phosphate transport system permease component